MATSAPTAGRNAWLKDANSFLLSAVCHLVVLILLGLGTVAAGRGWQRIELQARVSDELPGSADLQTVQIEAAPYAAVAADAESLAAFAPSAMSEVASVDSLFPVFVVLSALKGLNVGHFGRVLGGKGGGLGGQVGDATHFFGLGSSGKSFVYVVDCSDSMNDGRKFERACYELLQSIEQLGYDQRYFIILYNDQTYPMEGGKLVPATQDQFDQTRRWVGRVVPGGHTYPLPALLRALALKPDAIYFLSDGLFDPNVIAQLRVANAPQRAGRGDRTESRRVPIHTIAFVSREAQGLMRTIASQSGGKFRFVP
jgi:hypothetical protein